VGLVHKKLLTGTGVPGVRAGLHTGYVNVSGKTMNLAAAGNYARVVNVIGYASDGVVVPRPPIGPVGIELESAARPVGSHRPWARPRPCRKCPAGATAAWPRA
jgi:hypothetical protein